MFVIVYPAEGIFNSDWYVIGFLLVGPWEIFSAQSEFGIQRRKKNCHRQVIKTIWQFESLDERNFYTS